MADENTTENSDVENVQSEVDATIAAIDKQEVKVVNAATPTIEAKEQDKLDGLINKFDDLMARLQKIEERVSEPTVPAPEAKNSPEPETVKGGDGATEEAAVPVAKPGRRRLGAWGG